MINTDARLDSYVLHAITDELLEVADCAIVGGYARDAAHGIGQCAKDLDIAVYGCEGTSAQLVAQRCTKAMRAIGYELVDSFDRERYAGISNLELVLKYVRPGHIAVDVLLYGGLTLEGVLAEHDLNINQFAAQVTPESYPYADVCFYGSAEDYRAKVLRVVKGCNMDRLLDMAQYANDNGWCLSKDIREALDAALGKQPFPF